MERKKWYQSKGMLGGLAALIGAALTVAGKDISLSEIQNVIGLGLEFVGAALAIYGRFKAEKGVSL